MREKLSGANDLLENSNAKATAANHLVMRGSLVFPRSPRHNVVQLDEAHEQKLMMLSLSQEKASAEIGDLIYLHIDVRIAFGRLPYHLLFDVMCQICSHDSTTWLPFLHRALCGRIF